jgi:hypothetical protein
VRYVYLAWCFYQWWYNIGRNHWLLPNPSDIEYLEQVWKGEA